MWNKRFAASCLAIWTTALVGCASPAYLTSDSAIAAAEFAIEAAEDEEAGRHASTALEGARTKLVEAQKARDAREPSRAIRLAEEATVDAQLAEALALKAQAQE